MPGRATILNPAPAAELPAELLAACDVIVPNEHEVELLGGVAALLAAGCGRSSSPAAAPASTSTSGRPMFHVPPFDVTPVDTTGAGDAFCGSLAARLAAGDDSR